MTQSPTWRTKSYRTESGKLVNALYAEEYQELIIVPVEGQYEVILCGLERNLCPNLEEAKDYANYILDKLMTV